MPRIARAVALGFPHHIVQRGNNRDMVFVQDQDREKYLSLLKKYSKKWKSPLLAYCLMNNHIHLLLRPLEDVSLYKMMQGVTLCYTQYFNRKYKRTGRIWESRYHSCIVDMDRYLWAVARYIEQNPVRAGIVYKEKDYLYSSAKSHITGRQDDVLGEELFNAEQRDDYIGFISGRISAEEVREIRYFTKTGRPLGSEEFTGMMEADLQRKFKINPVGRPRKKAFNR